MNDFNLDRQIAHALVSIAIKGHDEYGRPLTDDQRSGFLAKAAQLDRAAISAVARKIEKQLSLLRPFLEATDDPRP